MERTLDFIEEAFSRYTTDYIKELRQHLVTTQIELFRVQSVLLHFNGQREQIIVALGPVKGREKDIQINHLYNYKLRQQKILTLSWPSARYHPRHKSHDDGRALPAIRGTP